MMLGEASGLNSLQDEDDKAAEEDWKGIYR